MTKNKQNILKIKLCKENTKINVFLLFNTKILLILNPPKIIT